jgi:Fe2+ or Zn2+ uptake regulation protein
MVDASGIETEVKPLARELDFRVDTHMLEFSGLCRECEAPRT